MPNLDGIWNLVLACAGGAPHASQSSRALSVGRCRRVQTPRAVGVRGVEQARRVWQTVTTAPLTCGNAPRTCRGISGSALGWVGATTSSRVGSAGQTASSRGGSPRTATSRRGTSPRTAEGSSRPPSAVPGWSSRPVEDVNVFDLGQGQGRDQPWWRCGSPPSRRRRLLHRGRTARLPAAAAAHAAAARRAFTRPFARTA